jgi:hypothetical protein
MFIGDARRLLDAGQPVSLVYIKKNGQRMEARNVVSLRYDFYTGLRTIKFLANGLKRTIHDVLIIAINEFEVFL